MFSFDEPDKSLAEHENDIRTAAESGEQAALILGRALAAIKAAKSYRPSMWAVYLRSRHDYTPQYARNLIRHFELSKELSKSGLALPNERQSRMLLALKDKPKQLAETWALAVKQGLRGKEFARVVAGVNHAGVSANASVVAMQVLATKVPVPRRGPNARRARVVDALRGVDEHRIVKEIRLSDDFDGLRSLLIRVVDLLTDEAVAKEAA